MENTLSHITTQKRQKMNGNVPADCKEDRPSNKFSVTSRSVEFLLKQVYLAHREKIKGLESEVQHLKSELKKQKNEHEDCAECKVLREELKKCKESYLETLADQKQRIELLEEKMLSLQQSPISKSNTPLSSKTNEESPCDMNMDKQPSKKQKTSDNFDFAHPLNVKKQKFFSLDKLGNLKKENSETSNLQPLLKVIAPETLDVDIAPEILDDADITVIGIYGKKEKESNKILMETPIVPESIDIDMLDVIEPEINDAACLVDGLMEVKPKHCNEIRTDIENHSDMKSPSLLPPISLLLRKPEHNIENKVSKQMLSLQCITKKLNESNVPHVSSADVNILVGKDATSPSLICPTENKLKLCLSIPQSNEHKINDVSCSSGSCFGNRNFLSESENAFVDMDETYFPLTLTSHNIVQRNGRLENNKDGDSEVIELDDAPCDVLMVEGRCISEAEVEQAKNQVALDINSPVIENSFDRIPKKDNDIKYKFKEEPVRKKEERAKLLGHPCKQCEEYYNKLDIPENEKSKRISKCSRHRAVHKPPTTPEHYWELDFPDTSECKARGYVNETQMIPLKSRRRCPLTLKKDKVVL